jgi:hypothetical protein
MDITGNQSMNSNGTVRMLIRAAGGLLVVSGVAGCGGEEGQFDAPEVAGEVSDQTDPSSPGGGTDESVSDTALDGLVPGYAASPYPPPPYGVTQNAIIRNLEFDGWRSPIAVNFDVSRTETISLGDFYNPDAPDGTELLMINAVAVWCSVCQLEYEEMRDDQIYQSLKSRGVEMLGVLFEDNSDVPQPAGYDDLKLWGEAFSVPFPLVLDPGLKTGSYFDRAATPMNMVVDARTMRIVLSCTGYNKQVYDLIDQELQARGR